MNEKINKKATGSYYTSASITEYIANWAIRTTTDSLLEPSFGDGVFLEAAIKRYKSLGVKKPKIFGVELQAQPYKSCLIKYPSVKCFLMDYMDYAPEKAITTKEDVLNA